MKLNSNDSIEALTSFSYIKTCISGDVGLKQVVKIRVGKCLKNLRCKKKMCNVSSSGPEAPRCLVVVVFRRSDQVRGSWPCTVLECSCRALQLPLRAGARVPGT